MTNEEKAALREAAEKRQKAGLGIGRPSVSTIS